jgi:hypothetical protein
LFQPRVSRNPIAALGGRRIVAGSRFRARLVASLTDRAQSDILVLTQREFSLGAVRPVLKPT